MLCIRRWLIHQSKNPNSPPYALESLCGCGRITSVLNMGGPKCYTPAEGNLCMKASATEFKLRMLIMVAIIVVGFWSPWLALPGTTIVGWGARTPLLEWLALEVSHAGVLTFTTAAPAAIVLGAIFAALGVVFRMWGAAYLSYGTIHHPEMQASTMMASGPYRYVRNPLYIGSWFTIAAICFLMPPTGALFTIASLSLFLLRLVLAEEDFLKAELGEPYSAYLLSVPRLIPRLRTNLPAAHQHPHWLLALLTELNSVGVFITLGILSWNYDHLLMLKAIVVSFGISLVIRAIMPQGHVSPDPA